MGTVELKTQKSNFKKAKTPSASEHPAEKAQADQEQLQEKIRQKAYDLYLQRSGQDGDDVQDWLTAEKIFLGK